VLITGNSGFSIAKVGLANLVNQSESNTSFAHRRVTSGQMFDIEDVRITTCFLTLVWYNGAAKYIPRQSFVFLLESLVKHLGEDDFDTLRGSVMTALSVLGRDRNARTRESEDDILWKLFVTSSHSNLAVAGRHSSLCR